MHMIPLPSFAVTMGPISWTYIAELACTKRFDAVRFEGLTLHLRGESTLKFRGRAVSLAIVSPQVLPVFVVIIVFFAQGIQLGI